MLERCEDTNGKRLKNVLADAGYCSTANFERGDDQTALFIATTKSYKRRKKLRTKRGGGFMPTVAEQWS